jgi:hypothetical protein
MNNLKTTMIALVALFAASTVSAGAYVVYENDVAFDKFDSLGSFDDTVGTLRLGTTLLEDKVYVEYGKFGTGLDFNTGESAEAGYKVNFGNFQIKGKVESTNVEDWSHKLETEVKYNF